MTVAINGGLFEKTKEGAKGTTIERVKEQITADIVTKIADKEGEKITKNDFKQIVEPKYGTIDGSGENLILKDKNYTIPLTEIWNDFDGLKINDHGYYENCIYGTEIYKKQLQADGKSRIFVYRLINPEEQYPKQEEKQIDIEAMFNQLRNDVCSEISEIKNMFPTQMSETSVSKQNGGKQR